MSVNYSFTISKLRKKSKVNELNDVVFSAECRGYAVSSDNQNCVSNFNIIIDFDYTDINPESFISFDQVDKDVIISWILSKEQVSSFDELPFVQDAINSVKNQLQALSEEQEIYVGDWSIFNTCD